jgi:hypothetical protein
MDAQAEERRASERDLKYTPHEHEELRAFAKKRRERIAHPDLAKRANGNSKPKPA